jgi:hypothetical protein
MSIRKSPTKRIRFRKESAMNRHDSAMEQAMMELDIESVANNDTLDLSERKVLPKQVVATGTGASTVTLPPASKFKEVPVVVITDAAASCTVGGVAVGVDRVSVIYSNGTSYVELYTTAKVSITP